MNALAFFETIISFVALVCGMLAGIFVFIGYVEELDLADRLCEYGAKLARRKKGGDKE